MPPPAIKPTLVEQQIQQIKVLGMGRWRNGVLGCVLYALMVLDKDFDFLSYL